MPTEAIFGLLGVIVGGVLQGVAAWNLERRRSFWAVRKSGRLFAPELGRCDYILTLAHEQGTTWRVVGDELRHALAAWTQHADVFAGTLRQDDWIKLLDAVAELEGVERMSRYAPDQEIDEEHRQVLGLVSAHAFTAGLTSSIVGMDGPRHRSRRLLIWLRHPFKKRDVDAETQEFMARYRARMGLDEPERPEDSGAEH